MYGAKLPSFHRTYETQVDTHVHLVHCRKPIIREVRPAVGFRQLSCQDLFNNHRYKHLKVNQIKKFVSNFNNCTENVGTPHSPLNFTSTSEVSYGFLLQ